MEAFKRHIRVMYVRWRENVKFLNLKQKALITQLKLKDSKLIRIAFNIYKD